MSMELVFRGCYVGTLCLLLVGVVYSRNAEESGRESIEEDQQRYLPYISGSMLPLFLVSLTILCLLLDSKKPAEHRIFSMFFGIFLHIGFFYIALILLLPLLRRFISARACAMLWMVPNYLYVTQYAFMELPEPLWVIRAPGKVVWILFGIWLAGFFGVLVWKIFSHLMYRAHILKDAVEVKDSDVLELWNQEIVRARIKRSRMKLVYSRDVATPLSVGLFLRTTRVVLPQRDYSADELTLIFRHEIIHIGREDAWSKFFLVFCTAMCWFNPLMWIAMRKSADDLELSCDETVLLESDDATRRKYANLILKTAADERGFTTCLSASAKALRYRLKNIMKPAKRRSGSLVVGILSFVMMMSFGYIALAYGDNTGAEILFKSGDTSQYSVTEVTVRGNGESASYECTDPETLNGYLSGLKIDRLTGNYTFSEFDWFLLVDYDAPQGRMYVALSDQYIEVYQYYGENRRNFYYLPDGADLQYLNSLIQPV